MDTRSRETWELLRYESRLYRLASQSVFRRRTAEWSCWASGRAIADCLGKAVERFSWAYCVMALAWHPGVHVVVRRCCPLLDGRTDSYSYSRSRSHSHSHSHSVKECLCPRIDIDSPVDVRGFSPAAGDRRPCDPLERSCFSGMCLLAHP